MGRRFDPCQAQIGLRDFLWGKIEVFAGELMRQIMSEILDTTKFIVENSDLVKINHERVTEFSKSFDHGKTKHWLSAAPFNFSHFTEEEKPHFLFIFNALSFSYWGEPNCG